LDRLRGTALNAFSANVSTGLPGPDWLAALRRSTLEGLDDVERPDADEEVWRYSRVGEIDLDGYAPLKRQRAADTIVQRDLSAYGEMAAVVVVRNGWVVETTSSSDAVDAGVYVGPVGEAPDGESLFGAAIEAPVDLFSHLNQGFGPEPVAVVVPDGVCLQAPIVVVVLTDADGAAVFPRVLVRCGDDAAATVVELHTSTDVDSLVVPVLEATVGRNGHLRHGLVQELGPRVFQLGHQAFRVGQSGRIDAFAAALGGDYARTRTDCRLVGRGAEGRLAAAYFGEADQTLDFRTFQDHAAPDTRSELLFKGALDGASRSIYTGLIRVRPEAVRTVANQTNRNVKLSPEAWAESVPNLEIETDDVVCSHASTVSPVDEDQRFFLESRGVPTVTAERLLLEGFFEDVAATAPHPAVAETLREALADRLDRRDANSGEAVVEMGATA
jgi:Fe-S cluster assembly protein SufD